MLPCLTQTLGVGGPELEFVCGSVPGAVDDVILLLFRLFRETAKNASRL